MLPLIVASYPGGYSGGTGFDSSSFYYGNGGGSFNGGTSQINVAAKNEGDGQVQITLTSATPTEGSLVKDDDNYKNNHKISFMII